MQFTVLSNGHDTDWCAAGVVVFFTVAAALSKQATIDYAQRKVWEHSRLFGRRVVKIREFPFSDFAAVVDLHRSDDTENTIAVGLRLRSGRRIWIRSFSAGGTKRGRGAEELRGDCTVTLVLKSMSVRANPLPPARCRRTFYFRRSWGFAASEASSDCA